MRSLKLQAVFWVYSLLTFVFLYTGAQITLAQNGEVDSEIVSFRSWIEHESLTAPSAVRAGWMVDHLVRGERGKSDLHVGLEETTVFCESRGWRIETRLGHIDENLIQSTAVEDKSGASQEQRAKSIWENKLETDMVYGQDGSQVTHYIHQNKFTRSSTPYTSIWESAPGMLRRIPELSGFYLAHVWFEDDRNINILVQMRDGRLRIDGLPQRLALEFAHFGNGYRLAAIEQKVGASNPVTMRWEFEWSLDDDKSTSRIIRRTYRLSTHSDRTKLAEDNRVFMTRIGMPDQDFFRVDLDRAVMFNPKTGKILDSKGAIIGDIPGKRRRFFQQPWGLVAVVTVGIGIFAIGGVVIRRWGR